MVCRGIGLVIVSTASTALAVGVVGWAPSAKCQAEANAFCNRSCVPVIRHNNCLASHGMPNIALKSGPGMPEWRCYAPGDLNPSRTRFEKGVCYCSRDSEIRSVLQSCGDPDPAPGPSPPPPLKPMPVPSVPKIPSGLPSSAVFWRGQTTGDGVVYPCVRIPSIINANGTLLAFSECRFSTGDGCDPDGVKSSGSRDVCARVSHDHGATWSNLTTIAKDSSQDTAVFDRVTGSVIVNINAAGGNAQVISKDFGKTWSDPISLSKQITEASAGPGVGIQLSADNPHHPGRLLFIGHAGAYVQDYVWYSDDHGTSYHMATTSTGKSLLKMDEAQLVELANGDVIANMRNNEPEHLRGVAISRDGGSTWSDIVFDHGLPEPVCMGSIIRSTPPYGDGNVYFSNPGQNSGRVNGRVRRSTSCTGLPPNDCSWSNRTLEVFPGGGYAYSCLVPLNETHIGLLWETNADDCTGPSCMEVFTIIPTALFQ